MNQIPAPRSLWRPFEGNAYQERRAEKDPLPLSGLLHRVFSVTSHSPLPLWRGARIAQRQRDDGGGAPRAGRSLHFHRRWARVIHHIRCRVCAGEPIGRRSAMKRTPSRHQVANHRQAVGLHSEHFSPCSRNPLAGEIRGTRSSKVRREGSVIRATALPLAPNFQADWHFAFRKRAASGEVEIPEAAPSVAPSTRIQEDGFSTSSDSNGCTLLPPRQRIDAASRSRPHPHKVRTSNHGGRRPRYVPMGNVQVRRTPPFRSVSNSLRGQFRRTVPLEHSKPKFRRLRVQLSPQRQSSLYAFSLPSLVLWNNGLR
jgi:hypothetical protein